MCNKGFAMRSGTMRTVSVLADEIVALSWAIELLRRQPRDYAPILDKCEQSLQRCQTLITELGPDDEDDPRETLH